MHPVRIYLQRLPVRKRDHGFGFKNKLTCQSERRKVLEGQRKSTDKCCGPGEPWYGGARRRV